MRVWWRIAVVAVLFVMGMAPVMCTGEESRDRAQQPDLNTILVVVDDMNDFACRDTPEYLPASSPWLAGPRGHCYENASDTTPVCCPARAELLSGQLPHNSGVERQKDAKSFDATRSVQFVLHSLGYETFGIGKLFNGSGMARKIALGKYESYFDLHNFWNTSDYHAFEVYDSGGNARLLSPPEHVTSYAGGQMLRSVEELDDQDGAYFGYIGFAAPHTQNGQHDGFLPPEPTPAHLHAPVPKFDFEPERNAEDKLLPFHDLDAGIDAAYLKRFNAARIRSLYDVDELVAALFTQLEVDGEIDNTAVFVVSDNGYGIHGENNWIGKGSPYPSSYDVPFYAYLPGRFEAAPVDDRKVVLADLAPTIFDMYDVQAPYPVDGHSLLGPYRRRTEYHEYRNERDKLVLDESGHGYFDIPSWRTFSNARGDTLVEFYTPRGRLFRSEYYARNDPGMKRNLLATASAGGRPSTDKLRRLHRRLVNSSRCAGTSDQLSPNPCT